MKCVAISPAGETRSVTPDTTALRFTFESGQSYNIEQAMFSAAILACATWHGLKQKLVDACALGKDKSDADKEQAFTEMLEFISGDTGEWLEGRAGGEGAGAPSIVAEALTRIKPDKYPDMDSAKAAVAAWRADKSFFAKIKVPALAAAVSQIRLERAQAKVQAATTEGVDTL